MIDNERKKKFVQGYLKIFRDARVSRDQREWFAKAFPSPTSLFYLSRTRDDLKTMGALFLMAWGMRTVKIVQSHELVDIWVGNIEDQADTFYSFGEYLLVIYHFGKSVDNRQMENLLCHTTTSRSLNGKPTLVLSEVNLPNVRHCFEQQHWPIIDASQNSTTATAVSKVAQPPVKTPAALSQRREI